MFTTSVGVFVFGLLATIAGGAVGAAIGGNYAFVLTGFCVLASWGVFAAGAVRLATMFRWRCALLLPAARVPEASLIACRSSC